MMQFVFDTNILVSTALKPGSIPSQALSRVQQVGQLVFSSATLTELEEVLGRPEFKKYILNSTPAEVFASITDAAIIMVSTDKSDFHCRDKKDIKFLQIAHAARVSCLVSGDTDLLVLHPFRGIPILNAADFLQKF